MRAAILLGLLTVILPMGGCLGTHEHAATFPYGAQDPPIARALDWLRERTHENGCIGPEPDGPCSHATTRDAVIAIAATGTSVLDWRPKGTSPVDYLLSHEDEVSLEESPCMPCIWAKTAVAYAASGLDVHSDIRLDPIDELDRLFDGTQFGDEQTINGDAWALFAYRGVDDPPFQSPIPELRTHLLSKQLADGGWSWSGSNESDAWTTATVIQALAATENASEPVRLGGWEPLLGFLPGIPGHLADQDGAESVESTAQGVEALTALGIRAGEGIMGLTLSAAVATLLEVQNEDGGFPHGLDGPSDFLATTQAIPALAGRPGPLGPASVTP